VLTSFNVTNATVVVGKNVSMIVRTSVLLNAQAALTVDDEAGFVGVLSSQVLTLEPGATLTVNTNGSFAWDSTAVILGTVVTQNSASLHLFGQTSYAPASAQLAGPVTISHLTVPLSSSVVFSNGLIGSDVFVSEDANITIQGGDFSGQVTLFTPTSSFVASKEAKVVLSARNGSALLGSGSFVVISSFAQVSNVNSSGTFEGSVILAGEAILNVQNLTVGNINFTEDSNATIEANGLTITGRANVTGPITAYGPGGLTISGSVIAHGSLSATNSTITIPVNGSLVAFGGFTVENTNISLGGYAHANFVLPPSSKLTVTQNANWIGNLTNNGDLELASDRRLQIWSGDYIQENTSLHVYLDKESSAALSVLNGSILLNNGSTIGFNIHDKPFLQSASFLVASASVGINGSFEGDAKPLEGSAIDRALDVNIDQGAKTITIKYNFNVNDVPPWAWAVLAIVIVLVIVAVIAVIVKCRRRHHYEMVR